MRLAAGLGLIALIGVSPVLGADRWSIDHSESALTFEATQQGGTFTGHFDDFAAEMRFSADDLQASRFDVTVDVTSIDTGSRQRDRELPKADWFDFAAFPEATFTTREIRETGDGYAAIGELRIRDKAHEITLPFTWETRDDTAQMQGEVTIDRTRYGIGQGDWMDPDAVGHDVRVIVDLMMTRAGN